MNEERLEYLKGTTTVGLTCDDGIVLSTDTRATAGHEIASKRARKLYEITDNIGVTVAGSVGDTQALVRTLRSEARYYRQKEGTPMSVKAAAKLTSNLFGPSRALTYLAVLIIGGVDDSGPSMYMLSLDGSMIGEKMVSTGSGSPVAYGYLESQYEEDISVEGAKPVAIEALKSAIERDIATGNEIKVAIITEEGYKELSSEKIKQISG